MNTFWNDVCKDFFLLKEPLCDLFTCIMNAFLSFQCALSSRFLTFGFYIIKVMVSILKLMKKLKRNIFFKITLRGKCSAAK